MNQRSFKHAWGVWRNGALSGIIGFGALFAVAEIRAQPIFTNINAGLTGVFNGSAAWGDYDNDGRLDILFTGRLNMIPGDFVASQIWRNTGSGFTNNGFNLSGAEFGSVSWGDYDNDGLLDFLVTGNSLSQNEVVWHNTGTGFTN